MKYLTLLMLLPFAVVAQITLQGGDSVTETYYCEPTMTTECPELSVDEYATHGGGHKYLAKKTNLDCRECHGENLRGTSDSIATVARTCIAPDKFEMPDNAMTDERWVIIDPTGEAIDIVGTSIGRVEVGDVVGCNMCHEEAKHNDRRGEDVERHFREDDD